MKKQTALDWYIDKINEMTFEAAIHFQLFKEGNEYEQAKAMEKEQIKDAYQEGDGDEYYLEENKIWSEQYYNETYNP